MECSILALDSWVRWFVFGWATLRRWGLKIFFKKSSSVKWTLNSDLSVRVSLAILFTALRDVLRAGSVCSLWFWFAGWPLWRVWLRSSQTSKKPGHNIEGLHIFYQGLTLSRVPFITSNSVSFCNSKNLPLGPLIDVQAPCALRGKGSGSF